MNTPQEFFALLYQNVPEQYIAELRFIPEGGGIPQRMWRKANYLEHGNFQALESINQHSHIYHRVALSLEERSRKQDICLVTALWLDIDAKGDDLVTKLEEHCYPPTMLIASGGGLHGYWLLKEPLVLSSDKDRAEFERTIEGMILDFGEPSADKHVKDCTRILRTPFFVNIKAKYAPDFPTCRVLWADDSIGDRYKFEHLHRRYAPLGTPKAPIIKRELPVIQDGTRPKWITDYLQHGVGEGSRNHRLYVVARWFNDVGDKSANAESELMARALADGLPQHEAVTTIKSAWSESPNLANAVGNTMRKRYAIGDVAKKPKKD